MWPSLSRQSSLHSFAVYVSWIAYRQGTEGIEGVVQTLEGGEIAGLHRTAGGWVG